jgi:hypothetical protein
MNRTEEDILLDFQPNIPVGPEEFDVEVVQEQPHPALDTYTNDMITERQDAAKRAKQAKRAAAAEAGDIDNLLQTATSTNYRMDNLNSMNSIGGKSKSKYKSARKYKYKSRTARKSRRKSRSRKNRNRRNKTARN